MTTAWLARLTSKGRCNTSRIFSIQPIFDFVYLSIILSARTRAFVHHFTSTLTYTMRSSVFLIAALAAPADAHIAAWANGMYCKSSNITGTDNSYTDTAVNPLYQKASSDWWFQHYQGCDAAPPSDGEFLKLPAGGSFTVELAHKRVQTTLSSTWSSPPSGRTGRCIRKFERQCHRWGGLYSRRRCDACPESDDGNGIDVRRQLRV